MFMFLSFLTTQAIPTITEQQLAASLGVAITVTYCSYLARLNSIKKFKLQEQLTQIKAHIQKQKDEHLSNSRQINELVNKFKLEIPGGRDLADKNYNLFFTWICPEVNKLDRVKSALKDNSDALAILEKIESHKALIYKVQHELLDTEIQERELEYAQSSIISKGLNCAGSIINFMYNFGEM